MKEIQKVVQKLSREQKSAAGGGGGGGVRTGAKHKVTPVYRGDLITKTGVTCVQGWRWLKLRFCIRHE